MIDVNKTTVSGGSRFLWRKLFIGYLVLTTGCTPFWQNMQPTKVAEKPQYQYRNWKNGDYQRPPAAATRYQLPELGGVQQQERAAPGRPAVTQQAYEQLMLGAAGSHQIGIADPKAKGYQGTDEFSNMARGMASSALTEAVQGYFGEKRVTAEVSVTVGEKGVRVGSADLLVPVYKTPKDLLFIQGGARRSNQYTESERTTANIGVGYRRTLGEWLFGVNGFYDKDLTGKNERVGVGAEVWTDNVKVSANAYHRLTSWKKSPDMENYLERPANGWDVRAEGYLPGHPQLGGKVMVEKYYGEQVGLFGSGNRQRNPSAATIGVTYTPIPLVTLSADHKRGQGGESQSSFKVGLNYQVGVPLEKQLSSDAVISARQLENARFNLVSRNNEIVLDYKQADNGRISLPAALRGVPATTLSFPVTVSGSVRNVTWTGSAAGFAMPYNGTGTGSVTLPAFDAGGANAYTLQAVGTGANGAPVTSNMMAIGVDAMVIALERSKPVAMADGSDAVTFTARLLMPSGEPQADSAITWDVQGTATVTEKDEITDSAGRARLSLVSNAASAVQVRATEPTGSQAESDVSFLGDPTTARVVSLTAAPAVIVANGLHVSTLTATIDDAAGNRVGAGVPVTWSTTIGDLAAASSTTDASGRATMTLTGTVAGAGTVTAGAVQGSANTAITLTADNASARVVSLVAAPAVILANGSAASTLTATVEDAGGNPVGAGVYVGWSTTRGDLAAASGTTDASGRATITLTGTQAGMATVTAASAAGSSTADVTLTADASTARVIGVTASPTVITADGADASTLTATVADANGNAVGAGVSVSWSTTRGDLAAASSSTDASGRATITLTSTQAGAASVTASAAAGSASAQVLVSADDASARVIGLTASPSTITADGSDSSTLTATIADANGNAVGAGVPVAWSTTRGDLAAFSSVTNSSGQAIMTLSGTAAGAAIITATAAAGADTVGVILQADPTTARVLSVSASPVSVAANGVDTSTLTATVVDANGNAMVAGVSVNWSTTLGSLSAASSLTDSAGKASIAISSSAIGTATATASAVSGSANTGVQFVADVASARVISLVASPASITADGAAASTLTATLQDASGNAIGAGVSVNWSTTRGDLAAASSTTNASGQAVMTLTGTQSGTASVTAAGPGGGASADVELLANPATARVVSVTASPSSITANGTAASTLTATVQDANGNPLGAGISVSWTATDGTLSQSTSTTNAAGMSAVALVSSTTAGTVTVTAAAVAGSAGTTVVFTPDIPAAPTSVTFTGSAGFYAAGIPDARTSPAGTVSWPAVTGASYYEQAYRRTASGQMWVVYSGSSLSKNTSLNGALAVFRASCGSAVVPAGYINFQTSYGGGWGYSGAPSGAYAYVRACNSTGQCSAWTQSNMVIFGGDAEDCDTSGG